MIIEDLADFLQTNGIGTVGTDIFIGELPLKVNNCVSLRYQVSPNPNLTLDVYEQDITIWGRNKSSKDCYQKLLDIQNLLHKKYNYELGKYHIYFTNALGSIYDNDVDFEMRKLYSLSLRFIYRTSTLVS